MTFSDELVYFDADNIIAISYDLMRPRVKIRHHNNEASIRSTMPTLPFVVSAKIQIRLATVCGIVRYYDANGWYMSVAKIKWNPMIRINKDQWKILKDHRKDEESKVPKLIKTLPTMKWLEAFTNFLHRVVGIRIIPLDCVARESATLDMYLLALAPESPHS